MTTSDYARAVLRYWWVLLLFVLVGIGGGYLRNTLATNVYASHVTFYISTPSDGTSAAYSSDQYAQSRANSYALLIASQRAAEAVIASSGLAMTTGQVMGEIHASVPLNTVLLTATVDGHLRRPGPEHHHRARQDLRPTGRPARQQRQGADSGAVGRVRAEWLLETRRPPGHGEPGARVPGRSGPRTGLRGRPLRA